MATPSIGFIGEALDLLIRQGGTFGPFEGHIINPDATSVDLTGSTIRGQIRKKALDPTPVASLAVTINPDQVGAGKGKYIFGMTDEATAVLPAGELKTEATSLYVWDLEWEDSLGRVFPLYYGKVTVQREVTRV